MPLVSMAAPFSQSNVYLVPDAGSLGTLTRIRDRRRKIILIKCVETFLICLALLLFVLANNGTTMQPLDIFMSVTFGICLMYTILVLLGPIDKSARSLIFFNFGTGILLAITAVASVIECISTQVALEEDTKLSSNIYDSSQKFINMKLSSGVILVMTAILYIGESCALILYSWDNIII